MKDTIYYIDQIKKSQGISSDYAVSKLLGVSRQTLSKYKAGRSTLDSDVCLKVAEILDISPFEILANIKASKSKKPEVAKKWADLARSASSTAAGVILSLSLVSHSPETRAAVDSPAPAPTQGAGALYIM